LILFAFLIGCKVPSKDLQTKNFLEWTDSILNKLNNIDLNDFDKKAKINFLKEEILSKKQLIGFYKNNSIHFYTKEELSSDFIQTLDNNSIILKKPVYITKKLGKIYVSSDGEEWFYVKPSDRKKVFNINHKIETQLDENKENLDVFLTFAVDVNKDYLTKKDITVNKPVVEFDPTVLAFKKGSKNRKKLPNLNKNIVYVPENTILKHDLNITGNIVNIGKEEDSVKTTALRDIYFYNNKKIFNLSFNRDKWDFSLHRVKFDKEHDVIKEENEVNFILNVSLNYKDKI
jgi:hypothetical protein